MWSRSVVKDVLEMTYFEDRGCRRVGYASARRNAGKKSEDPRRALRRAGLVSFLFADV